MARVDRQTHLGTSDFWVTNPKKVLKPAFFLNFNDCLTIFRIFRAAHLNFPSFFAGARAWARGTGPGPGPGPAKKDGKCFFFSARVFQAVWAQKGNFSSIFYIFSAFFPNIWPLAGPNIAKKGWPLQKLARGDRQTHFGTFNFWVKPDF